MSLYEIIEPSFHNYIVGNALSEPLGDGFRRAEGPAWFGDPAYGIAGDHQGARAARDLPCNVYRLDPSSGDLTVATDVFKAPHGLTFGPGERQIYVAETGEDSGEPRPHIRVFDASEDGRRLCNGRVFYEFEQANADGFRCDEDGNLWCGQPEGVLCIIVNTRGLQWP